MVKPKFEPRCPMPKFPLLYMTLKRTSEITYGTAAFSYFTLINTLVPLFWLNAWPDSGTALLKEEVHLRNKGSIFSTSYDTHPRMQTEQKSVWLLLLLLKNQLFQSRHKTKTLSPFLSVCYFSIGLWSEAIIPCVCSYNTQSLDSDIYWKNNNKEEK